MWVLIWVLGCADRSPEPPPEPAAGQEAPSTARVETHRAMVEDREAVRHPSDGGGRAWLADGPASVVAGERGRWELVYEAGEAGIAEGGSLVFQAPAFWGWDTPQVQSELAPGYTWVRGPGEGLRLEAVTVDQGMLRVAVRERALRPGEQVRLVYGAGEAGARADRFAETGAELWFAVDGDGDGIRKLLDRPVTVDVLPGPPARLLVTLPTTARPGEAVSVVVAALDARGNGPASLEGTVRLEGSERLGLPVEAQLAGGLARVALQVPEPGVFAVRAAAGGLSGESNPLLVAEGAQRVLWGDLQIHTGRSDGTGRPSEVWRYAREVAGLDVAAVTDHDHWGMRFFDQHPELWAESVEAAEAANEPGAFVAIAGSEWTSWLYGHRHLLWFEPDPPLISSFDPSTDRPDRLWQALAGRKVLTVAHHSAGGPVAVDWSFRPPPDLEPVTEVVSVHGQSESPTAPGAIYDAVAGNFVVDQLRDGLRLGLIGSTDGHDGHPGLAHLNAPSGGLVALIGAEHSRESVRQTLLARRAYATNGPRILVSLDVAGAPMGAEVATAPEVALELRVFAGAPVVQVVEVRKEGERPLVEGGGSTALRHQWTLAAPPPGDFVYLRVLTADGGMAWTSPVWFVDGGRGP